MLTTAPSAGSQDTVEIFDELLNAASAAVAALEQGGCYMDLLLSLRSPPSALYPASTPARSVPGCHLDQDDVARVVNSLAFAEHRGTPLTCHLTLLWRHTKGFDPARWTFTQTRCLDRMSRYLKRQGIEPCFVWVREVGRIKHEHTHLLVHLPEWHRGKNYVQLRAELVSRLTGIGGFRANGIRIGRNPGYPGTPAMRWGWGCYFLKSLDPALTIGLGAGTVSLAEVLGIRLEQDLMPLSGRRSHSTENLGPKARLEAGYREVDDPLGLAHLLSQGSCLTRRGRRARKRSRVPPPPH